MRGHLALAILALLLTVPGHASTIIVQPDSMGDYPTIQEAINAAEDGDVIELTDGTFTGDGNRDITYDGRSITIRSQNGNPEACTINVHGDEDEPHIGFSLFDTGPDATLEGVTVRGGYGPYGCGVRCQDVITLRNCRFTNSEATVAGGGVYCTRSGVAIIDCFFSESYAPYGGGLCISDCSPTVTGCTFDGCVAGYGGGMACREYASPSIEDCEFLGNQGRSGGGGLYCEELSQPMISGCNFDENYTGPLAASGGGCSCVGGSSPEIDSCTFTGNSATHNGGGMYVTESSDPSISECTFSLNIASNDGGGIYFDDDSTPSIDLCGFFDNSADDEGGGLYGYMLQELTVDSCVFSGNHASWRGGGLMFAAAWGNQTLHECRFHQNTASEGGGAYLLGVYADLFIYGNTFWDNAASVRAGGLCLDQCSLLNTVTFCTFGGNSAPVGSGIALVEGGVPIDARISMSIVAFGGVGEGVKSSAGATALLTCCNVYGNEGGDWVGDIADQYGVDGNFSADPLFRDLENGNLQLHCDSPCLGIPECGGIGGLGVGGLVWRVPEDFHTIQAAIDSVMCADTVLVACDTYYEHDIDIDKRVVLRSETCDPDCATIDAQGQDRVFDCSFIDSTTVIEGFTITGGSTPTNGGGFDLYHASPTIQMCKITGNTTAPSGFDGGGLYCRHSKARLIDCVISENTATDDAGGIYCRDSSDVRFMNCVIANNTAADWGGGLFCWNGSEPELRNCTFYGNSGVDAGGISSTNGSRVSVRATIVSFSSGGQGIYCDETSDVTLHCSDVYGNVGGDWVGCISGQFGVAGNFSEDPLFCDAGNTDFTLREDSPCAAGNSPEDCGLIRIGARDVGCVDPADAGEITSLQVFRLDPPRPNPFNPVTFVRFATPRTERIHLTVHDISGRLVAVLIDGLHPAGEHNRTWDGRDDNGHAVGSGVYVLQMVAGDFEATRKLVLLK